MIKFNKRWPPENSQVRSVIDYLNSNFPIDNADIEFRYQPMEHFYLNGQPVYGICYAINNTARVKIAVRNRFIRSIARTTAHEYMHCIQFIQRGINFTKKNEEKLEREAVNFSDEILVKLWEDRGVFCPSTL